MLTLKFGKLIVGIYCIKNLITGKIYVGSSINTRKRIYQHATQLRKNIHRNQYLQNAFNKYGENQFVAYMLEFLPNNSTNDEINNAEQKWLDKLKPFGKSGYNIEPLVGRFGVAPETKKKISKGRIRAWKNPTQAMLNGVKKSTETQRNNGHFQRLSELRKGKVRSDIDREKLSKSISESEKCKAIRKKIADNKRGKKRSPEECTKIKQAHQNPIIQYDAGGKEIARFMSLRDMRISTGFAPCEVAKVCKGIYPCYPKSLGYKWSYAKS